MFWVIEKFLISFNMVWDMVWFGGGLGCFVVVWGVSTGPFQRTGLSEAVSLITPGHPKIPQHTLGHARIPQDTYIFVSLH